MSPELPHNFVILIALYQRPWSCNYKHRMHPDSIQFLHSFSCSSAFGCMFTWLGTKVKSFNHVIINIERTPSWSDFFFPSLVALHLGTKVKSFHHVNIEWTPCRSEFFIPSLVALHLNAQYLHDSETKVKSFHHVKVIE